MKVITPPVASGGVPDVARPIGIELTRRNLTVLLRKLDMAKGTTACTIIAPGGSGFYVKAVEDEAHYADRTPGAMLVEGEWV